MMPETSLTMMMVQSVAALAAVLAIFAGLVWALRKLQHHTLPHQGRKLKVVQRLSLDAKNSVVEIQYEDQHFLLGVGQAGVHKIADIDVEKMQGIRVDVDQHSPHAKT
ncbi:MAG: flagellar biosynthetic protein FliO [Mariprofundaceae bacterium]|nr:flagellar biosynthetic protein FliO [Mariprofundaceae bacterium]